MRRVKPLLALIVLALLVGPEGRAAVLDGTYDIAFSGPQSLWPLEDVDACEQDVVDGVAIELCIDMDFMYDGAGGVSGTGSFDFTLTDGVDVVQAFFVGAIQGKAKGSDTKGWKHGVRFKFAGTVAVNGQVLQAQSSGKLATAITTDGLATTRGSLKLSIKGIGSVKGALEPPLVQQLPIGDWTLTLTVTHQSGSLSGTLDFTLPAGVVQIPVTGKYNAKKDESSLKAKGDKADPAENGISLGIKRARSTGPGNLSGEVAAKLQGLKLKTSIGP